MRNDTEIHSGDTNLRRRDLLPVFKIKVPGHGRCVAHFRRHNVTSGRQYAARCGAGKQPLKWWELSNQRSLSFSEEPPLLPPGKRYNRGDKEGAHADWRLPGWLSPEAADRLPQAAIFCERMYGATRWACSGSGSGPGRSWLMLTTALLLSAVVLLSGLPGLTEAKECDKPCMNGQCNTATGSCVCFPGWVGDQCQHCGGRFRYTEHSIPLVSSLGPVPVVCSSLEVAQRFTVTATVSAITTTQGLMWNFKGNERKLVQKSFRLDTN